MFRFIKNNLILILLFGLSLFLSLWRLPYSPATWFDEGINIGIAKSLVQDGVYSLKVGPQVYVPTRQFLITTNYPVILPVSLSLRLLGFTLEAARLPMVLFILGYVVAIYFLVKKLYGHKRALMSLALTISFVPFYGNGKDVLGEVPGLLYFILGILILSSSYANWKKYLGTGLMFGLSMATKPFFLIIFPAIIIGFLYGWWKNDEKLIKPFFLIVGGTLVPIIVWIKTIVPSFSFFGISKALFYYANSYATSSFFPLITANFFRFFKETTPLHFAILGFIVFLAMLLKFLKKESIQTVEVTLLAFIFINFCWYLKTPGWYRYFFPAHMILFILFPASLSFLFKKDLRKTTLVIIALFLVQFSYLLTKRNEELYNSNEAIVFSEKTMEQTKPGDDILLINSPSVAFLLSNRSIYQYLQINPQLYFGSDTLQRDQRNYYQYIVTNGSLEGVAIPEVSSKIGTLYHLSQNIGHYTLYKRNTP